jgi:hypothetical protein
MIDNYVDESYRNMAKDLQYWKILTRLFREATKDIKRRPPVPSTPIKSVASPSPSSPSPSSPSPSKSSSEHQKICKTEKCDNNGKEVATKRCPECGNEPEAVVAGGKTCGTLSCANYRKAVSSKFCSECGAVPNSGPPGCQNVKCVLYGKEVSGKFCHECGGKI